MEDTGVTDGSSIGVGVGVGVPAMRDDGVTDAEVSLDPDDGVAAVDTGVPVVSFFPPVPVPLQPASRRSAEVRTNTCFFIFKPTFIRNIGIYLEFIPIHPITFQRVLSSCPPSIFWRKKSVFLGPGNETIRLEST